MRGGRDSIKTALPMIAQLSEYRRGMNITGYPGSIIEYHQQHRAGLRMLRLKGNEHHFSAGNTGSPHSLSVTVLRFRIHCLTEKKFSYRSKVCRRVQGTDKSRMQGTQSKRMQGPQTRKMHGTQSRQMQGTQTRRTQGTQTRKTQGTETSRKQGTQTKRMQGTLTRRIQGTQTRRLQGIKTRKRQGIKS